MTRISANQNDEIQSQRGNEVITCRATVTELERILYYPTPVLDHGFVRVIDYMGDDAAIVQAARVSYGSGTKKVSDDRGLIRYLMRHRHTSPFEMCEIKLHIKLPIFIARQWIRHRTASVNEYSARYSELDNGYYLPETVAMQAKDNKQGSDGEHPFSSDALELWKNRNDETFKVYQDDLEANVSREIARINLPLSSYTEFYWKIDLHNLMHFTSLRADSHAQSEIRAYADVMLDVLKRWVPITYEAFVDYRKEAVTLSRPGLDAVKQMIKGVKPIRPDGMSDREWDDLCTYLGIDDS